MHPGSRCYKGCSSFYFVTPQCCNAGYKSFLFRPISRIPTLRDDEAGKNPHQLSGWRQEEMDPRWPFRPRGWHNNNKVGIPGRCAPPLLGNDTNFILGPGLQGFCKRNLMIQKVRQSVPAPWTCSTMSCWTCFSLSSAFYSLNKVRSWIKFRMTLFINSG